MTNDSSEIYKTGLDQGVALAWVNSYSGVVVRTPGATLLFDPVGMDLPSGVLLDLIAVSHGHSDHWEPELVAGLQQRTRAVVAASPSLTSRLYANDNLRPLQPGDDIEIGDVTVTALRCDHAAPEPLSFLVRTSDGVTVYLPGDTTPFPEMRRLPEVSHPRSLAPREKEGRQAKERIDILMWMGTALEDGAKIAQLAQPKVFLTYAITPPAAGVRAASILTRYTPDIPFHPLERHQVFKYPPLVTNAK